MKADRMIRNRSRRPAAWWTGVALAAPLAVLAAPGPAGEALAADAALAAPAGADAAVLDDHAAQVVVNSVAQLSPRAEVRDQSRLPALKRLLEARRAGRSDLVGRQIQPLSRRDALRQGLERNLQLAIGRVNPDRARDTLNEVRAVFDPVFDFQIGYSYATTFKRAKTGLVTVRTIGTNGNVADFSIPPNNPCGRLFSITDAQLAQQPVVVALEFYNNTNCAGGKAVNDTITASPSNAYNHPKQQITYTLGLTQQLPWGGQVVLTDQTVQQKVWYRSGHAFDDNQFTTNFTGSLTSPVPFGKGFGKDNANNANIRTQETLQERSGWELKALVNQTTRDIDFAYLEVVRALEALKNTDDNRSLVGRLHDRTNRLFEQSLSTRFQKAQLDNEYAKAGIRTEDALQAYVNASVTLARLIGDPDAATASTLYLPYAEGAELTAEAPFKLEAVLAAARQNRPDYFVSGLNRTVAEIALGRARNQALPDVQVSANVVSGQNGSVIGHANPGVSQLKIANPDSLTQTYGLTYTYPWLNRAADAAAERAEFGLESSDVDVRDTETRVRQEITSGLAALQSARARARYAADQVRGLDTAVGSLQRRLEVGVVGEDELITTTLQLLNARLDRTNAVIAAKQAETALFYARGTIGGDLVSQTSQTVADRRRLQILAGTGHLGLFATAARPVETAAVPSPAVSR